MAEDNVGFTSKVLFSCSAYGGKYQMENQNQNLKN